MYFSNFLSKKFFLFIFFFFFRIYKKFKTFFLVKKLIIDMKVPPKPSSGLSVPPLPIPSLRHRNQGRISLKDNLGHCLVRNVQEVHFQRQKERKKLYICLKRLYKILTFNNLHVL